MLRIRAVSGEDLVVFDLANFLESLPAGILAAEWVHFTLFLHRPQSFNCFELNQLRN